MFTLYSARTIYRINWNPLRSPAIHRILHRCFPCISQLIVPKVELGQDRIDLQRLRDRLGTLKLNPDVVVREEQGRGCGQDRDPR
jgi:hypothetical protein